jgi:hypothetical protein
VESVVVDAERAVVLAAITLEGPPHRRLTTLGRGALGMVDVQWDTGLSAMRAMRAMRAMIAMRVVRSGESDESYDPSFVGYVGVARWRRGCHRHTHPTSSSSSM